MARGACPTFGGGAVAPEQRARRLIDENDHMVIATADPAGVPWVSPVFYVPDERNDLCWISGRKSNHSENIRDNPAVSVVIFETEPEVDAVYMSAQAAEINDPDEVSSAARLLERKEQPDKWKIQGSADVTGDGPWRIYRATPRTIEVRVEGVERGKAMVGREPADFRLRSSST